VSNLRLFDVRYREVSTEKRVTVDLSIGKCPGTEVKFSGNATETVKRAQTNYT
jgi:hypothetical protein